MSHLNELKPMEKIPDGWLERLRKGNWVWLPKEKQFARITWEYEPPEPGTCAGRIALDRFEMINDQFHYRGQQTWFICAGGTGFDGKQLIHPCEGQLPENPQPIPEPEIRQINRELAKLRQRCMDLDAKNRLLGGAYLKIMEKVADLEAGRLLGGAYLKIIEKVAALEAGIEVFKEEVKARLAKKKLPTVQQVAGDLADLAIKHPKKKSEPSDS